MAANFTIEDGIYGRRAVLKSEWEKGAEQVLLQNGVVELELNSSKGWRGNDISFVKSLPDLRAFSIIDLKIPSVDPVHFLQRLRKIEIITYCKTKIDFSSFPLLEDCAIEWRNGASSLFSCKTIRILFINRYNEKDASNFSKLIDLENLTILNSSIISLEGLSSLNRLRVLRIGNLRNLTSLSGIEKLKHLEELEIQKCNKITEIKELAELPRLRSVAMNDSGAIESIRPLAKTESLETLLFYGTTNILDGDLSPLKNLKRLSNVSYQNRRHYSHRRDEFTGPHDS